MVNDTLALYLTVWLTTVERLIIWLTVGHMVENQWFRSWWFKTNEVGLFMVERWSLRWFLS